MIDITVLEEIGLDDKEARVYTALLELGSSTVQPIARKASLQRPNTYPVLESLVDKGLVSYFEKNNRRHYVAEDPTVLSRMMSERWQRLNQFLPELRSIFNQTPHKPKVRFYEGKEEVHALYEHLIEVKSYDCIYSPGMVLKTWGEYSPELGRRIAEAKVRVRELISTEGPKVGYERFYKKPLQEIRYIPQGEVLLADLILFENKLAFISYDTDIHTVVIEGSGIIQAVQALFNYMWSVTSVTKDTVL